MAKTKVIKKIFTFYTKKVCVSHKRVYLCREQTNKNINIMKLNPYTITWAFLIPTKGIATNKDELLSFTRDRNNTCLRTHAANREEAIKKVNELNGRLSKEYSVLFITDKQFGMIKSNNIMEVATGKQLSEMFKIY